MSCLLLACEHMCHFVCRDNMCSHNAFKVNKIALKLWFEGFYKRAAWGWGRRYYCGNEANFMTDTAVIAGMGIAFMVVPWER